ncbi:MAG: NAD(P)-binding domain-containing protein, partial [Clostridia bacterium]|nr:NAD(P)-binding domain-containing protein [Clostridia bacterium]
MSYGFIGTGHMGSSLAIALATVTKDLTLSDLAAEKAAELAAKLGCHSGNAEQA